MFSLEVSGSSWGLVIECRFWFNYLLGWFSKIFNYLRIRFSCVVFGGKLFINSENSSFPFWNGRYLRYSAVGRKKTTLSSWTIFVPGLWNNTSFYDNSILILGRSWKNLLCLLKNVKLFLPCMYVTDGSSWLPLGIASWQLVGLLDLLDWWWFLTNSGRHELSLDRVLKLIPCLT